MVDPIIGAERVQMQSAFLLDRVSAEEPAIPWIVKAMPVVVQPSLRIVILCGKAERLVGHRGIERLAAKKFSEGRVLVNSRDRAGIGVKKRDDVSVAVKGSGRGFGSITRTRADLHRFARRRQTTAGEKGLQLGPAHTALGNHGRRA